MALSTNLISGLSSGFDWRSMIDQLMAVEHRRVDLVTAKKTGTQTKLTEWQSFNTKLLSLKTAAGNLNDPESFDIYKSSLASDDSTVKASDLLSVSTTSSASKGSYNIVVDALATAQKLSSGSFSGFSDALGASYAGDIIINGRAISVNATDSLADVRNKINNANSGTNPTGVSASIVTYSANDHRLILTSDNTGEQGIGLQNGSGSDLVQLFGWKDKSSSLRNSITGGAQSDAFSGSTQNIKSLLDLSTTQSGTIKIRDGLGVYQDVSIDLSTDSLEDIKTAINDAAITGVTASVVDETSGNTKTYKLQINGSQDLLDAQNILDTLGVLQNGVSLVQGTTSANSMTANGNPITSSTLLIEIDGYNQYTAGDKISLGAASRDHSNVDVSGDILAITETTTIQDLLDAIKTAYEDGGDEVSVYPTSDGKIQVVDLETGASSLVVELESTIGDMYSSLDWGAFTSLAEVRKRQLVAGADASLWIDDVNVTSSDNSVDDVLSGVTLNLLKADSETTLTLGVDRDIDAVTNKIQGFVSAYNVVSAYLKEQQTYDQENEEAGGILFGDGTLSSVKSDITTILTQQVWGVASDLSTLGLAGIEVDTEGQLNIDSAQLKGYLETRFNDIKLLFSINGTTDAGYLSYVRSSRDTKAGEYEVIITQAATRSSETSDTDTLDEDETMTITQDGKTANVLLTSGMTISGIINAVNTEMDTVYTQKLAGSVPVKTTGGVISITSGTTWNNINGGNLVNDDVITFSATARNGSSVSGSYTISDTGTDTVQGLLSTIETAYGGQVTAAIATTGQVIITDKAEGASSIALTFDYTQTENEVDIFGSVAVDNSGGQKGRWTMNLAASNDGSNHLLLTHDSYGSSYSFTIVENTDTGLWAGSQTTPVSVNNGLDVEGTIKGEAATGSGQTLTGNSGEANVGGLVIRCSGSSTGIAGNVTLTLGIAELFDRTLFNITDSFEGYLDFKQESLQNSINGYETQIEQMEARLEKKMEMMINRFVAMETALAKMQSQSNWLSSQIDGLYSGWR
jgi:flagellar hook-associated protein 2